MNFINWERKDTFKRYIDAAVNTTNTPTHIKTFGTKLKAYTSIYKCFLSDRQRL